MKRVLWIVFWLFAAVWSGLAWLVWVAIGAVGRGAAANVDFPEFDPEWVEWLSSASLASAAVGRWFVVGLWALGLVLVFAVVVLVQRIMTRRAAQATLPPA